MSSCTGVADHIVFVFNVMQPPPATWELLKTGFDFPKFLLGNRKDIGWCAETSSPTSVSIGWEFGTSCSVGGLWVGLNICFVLLSCWRLSARLLLSITHVSSFTVIDGGMKNLKELIRFRVFLFDFPATAGLPANDMFLLLDGLSIALDLFIATRWARIQLPVCCRHLH